MRVLVARVGKSHGLRGEVTVLLHTDAPEERFTPGTVLEASGGPPGAHALTVSGVRVHNGRWLVKFAEATDRTAAEALRGTELYADAPEGADSTGDGWYEEEMVGLRADLPDGTVLGEVIGLQPRPAQDLLQVRRQDGCVGLIPFVHALVPVVDVAAGRVVIDPPGGIFDIDIPDPQQRPR